MIHKPIYECDKCHVKTEDPDQFFSLIVHAKDVGYSTSRPVTDSFDVCRNCLEDLGIWRRETQDIERPAPLTVEELIGEIIERCKQE